MKKKIILTAVIAVLVTIPLTVAVQHYYSNAKYAPKQMVLIIDGPKADALDSFESEFSVNSACRGIILFDVRAGQKHTTEFEAKLSNAFDANDPLFMVSSSNSSATTLYSVVEQGGSREYESNNLKEMVTDVCKAVSLKGGRVQQ
jgi:hypothetical protein